MIEEKRNFKLCVALRIHVLQLPEKQILLLEFNINVHCNTIFCHLPIIFPNDSVCVIYSLVLFTTGFGNGFTTMYFIHMIKKYRQ